MSVPSRPCQSFVAARVRPECSCVLCHPSRRLHWAVMSAGIIFDVFVSPRWWVTRYAAALTVTLHRLLFRFTHRILLAQGRASRLRANSPSDWAARTASMSLAWASELFSTRMHWYQATGLTR